MKKIYYDKKWISFWTGWTFDLSYKICGYFDNRPNIHIGLIFFTLVIRLPFRNDWTDECDPPKWGVAIHGNTLWIYKGGKGNMNGGNEWWTWDIPFVGSVWIRTSILLNDDTWEHETRGNRKSFWTDEWADKKKTFRYKYTDKHDGAVVDATVTIEEREWRPKWLTWTKLFAKVDRTIAVEFSDEVGSGKGSWKGGTLGCGWSILPGESPLDCIKRMEAEREF